MSGQLLDDFTEATGWMAVASGQAQLQLSVEPGAQGNALRLDFDFRGGGGFVVARKVFSLTVPDVCAFHFNIRGVAPANKFEFKLADPSGHNVWWYHQDTFAWPTDWQPFCIRSRHIEFAWGPAGGGSLHQVGAIEFAIAAGPGGKGTVWIEDFRLEDLSVRLPPIIQASSALQGHAPDCVLDGNLATSWRSQPGDKPQWLSLDFQQEREYGGLIITWDTADGIRDCAVQTGNDGTSWQTAYSAQCATGEHSYIYLPQGTSRHLRLYLTNGVAGQGFGIRNLAIQPYDFSRSRNAFFQNIAQREPKGYYPNYLYGAQSYWTPVGIVESVTQALLNEEGLLEVDQGSFSIEPFLYVDGALLTWADVTLSQSLEQGYLPIPSVRWQKKDGLALTITAFATDDTGQAVLYVRYRLENTTAATRQIGLFAAIRPFQVTPPWQTFRTFGGVSQINTLDYTSGSVVVNGDKIVIALTAADQFGAATFDQGAITAYLRSGKLPAQPQVNDHFGYASGALRYDLELAPGAVAERCLAIPFGTGTASRFLSSGESLPGRRTDEAFALAVQHWQTKLEVVQFRLPPSAQALTNTCKTAAAHILINRAGPALQPGPRRYIRCWIRDGATMAAALLRLGCTQEIAAFIRWYATYQAADGNVPAIVDDTGPDWLPEHDSHGEFIYLIMAYFHFTGDATLVTELWPAVVNAVNYIENLRNQRLGADYQTPEKRACYGLLPESASHEGYLAHPVHAYWDDFWTLRGLKDAAALAAIVGDTIQARRIAALRDDFQDTLYASIPITIAERHIPYIPGSVEWADFDPTATANAIALLDALPHLPVEAVNYTFDEYLAGFRKRHGGDSQWANYTPYEIRIIGALVRLSRREDAQELARVFLADRRPRSWNQWPEIAWREFRSPGHLGDLPHTWIAAEYILAFCSLFAFEREADQALVIAAGLAGAWLDEAGGVAVEKLPTLYGRLSYTLERLGDDTLRLVLGDGLTLPPGNIIIQPPLPGPLVAVTVNSQAITAFTPASVALDTAPAEVILRHAVAP